MLIYLIFFYVKPQDSFESIVNVKLDKVDKVDIFCGTSGTKKIITDKDEVKEFVNMFKDIDLKKRSNQEQGVGFIFNVFFYTGNKKVASFDFGYDVITIYKKNRTIKYKSNISFDDDKITEIRNKYNLYPKDN